MQTHVICYHGLGDALRYALPLAESLAEAGTDVFLHTRCSLLPCIGKQEAIKRIVSIPDEKLAKIGDMALAAKLYLDATGRIDFAVEMGSSGFDQALERELLARGVPLWGRGGVCNGAEAILDVEACKSWHASPEYFKDVARLCSIFKTKPPERLRLNPDPAFRAHRLKEDGKPLAGLHCESNWPSRNYPHGDQVAALLSDEYRVWRFDKTPCQNLAELAWIMKDSVAVMTVNSMPLHLARLCGALCLNLQGPVWLNKEEAPFLIKESRTAASPLPPREVDRQTQLMASLDPQFVAAEFKAFVKAQDKKRWQAD